MLTEESFNSTLRRLNEENMSVLWEIWHSMGIDREAIKTRCDVIYDCISEKYGEMIKEENSYKTALIESIEGHYKKQFSLCKELGVPVEEPSATLTTIELEKALRVITEDLLEQKASRMKEVLRLKRQDEDLCGSLNMDPYYISSTVIPKPSEFEGLKAHIKKMSELKKERMGIFVETKLAIINLMTQLECEPNSSFERAVVCEEDETFQLSASNIESVKSIHDNLTAKLKRNQFEADRLRDKIETIHNKLDMDKDEIGHFLSRYSGHSPSILKELQLKLEELEVLKSQHMEKFIKSAREELEHWWDKCFYNRVQRALFEPYFSNDFSEELLQIHEDEINKIRSYFTENEHLFSMVLQYQNLWHKKLELEAKMKDPNRFQGKSTDFLKEEKDRKRVSKQLPKVEAELLEAIEEYEQENKEDFLVGGIPFKVHREQQVLEHEQLLEKEKREKLTAKKRLLMQETMYGARPATPAKLNSTKRKAITTPGPESNKRPKPSTSSNNLTRNTANSTKLSSQSRAKVAASKRRTARTRNDTSIITGSNQLKTDSSLSSLSSINTDCNPFQRSQIYFANSTFQPTPETPVTRSQRNAKTSTYSNTGPILRSKPSSSTITSKTPFKTPTSRRVLTPVNKKQKPSSLRLPFLI